MPAVRVITPALEDKIARWATRPSGITVPEAVDALGVSKWTVIRAVARMVQARRLVQTTERRARRAIFERAGRGGLIYRASQEERRKWVGSRRSKGRPRTRGRWW